MSARGPFGAGLLAALLGAALVLAFGPPAAWGQEPSRRIEVSAEIVTPAVAGRGIQPLRFGPLVPGTSAEVPPGPAAGGTSSAGWYVGEVRGGGAIAWTLALPATLFHEGHALPVEWDGPGYGLMCLSSDREPTGARAGRCLVRTTFNPASGALGRLAVPRPPVGGPFDMIIYVGARTSVPMVPPGVYRGRVTLTLSHLF